MAPRFILLALALAACQTELTASPGLETADDLVISGDVPADYDLDAATRDLLPGQILVIGAPGQSELTTVQRVDPERAASFDLVGVDCPECNTGDSSCASYFRSMDFELEYQYGDTGQHRAWPIGSENFTPMDTEQVFMPSMGGTSTVNFGGMLSTCAPFGLVIDVESTSEPTGESEVLGFEPADFHSAGVAGDFDTCGEAIYNSRCATDWGLQWVDVGTTMPTSLTFEFDPSVLCRNADNSTQSYLKDLSLNGVSAGSFDMIGDCLCTTTIDYAYTSLTLSGADLAGYQPNAVNQLTIDHTSGRGAPECEGIRPTFGLAGSIGQLSITR